MIVILQEQPKQKSSGQAVAYHLTEFWQMDTFDLSRYEDMSKDHRYIYIYRYKSCY